MREGGHEEQQRTLLARPVKPIRGIAPCAADLGGHGESGLRGIVQDKRE